MRVGISNNQKKELRNKLYKRHAKHGRYCHYCGIKEDEFTNIWGEYFYGGIKRGRILEIDCKDNRRGYDDTNCVLACALCNMAKSDKFTEKEFKRVDELTIQI